LPNSDGRVDSTTLLEERADGAARTLGGNKDDINILRGNDTSVLLEDNGETVGEVESLALGDEGSDLGPCLGLSSVGEEVHDDSTPVDGLLDGEEGLSGHPAVLNGLLPGLAILADTDNHVEALVAGVETLAVALGAVTDESEGVVLEVLLELGDGPVGTLVDDLLGTSEVKSLDTTSLL